MITSASAPNPFFYGGWVTDEIVGPWQGAHEQDQIFAFALRRLTVAPDLPHSPMPMESVSRLAAGQDPDCNPPPANLPFQSREFKY